MSTPKSIRSLAALLAAAPLAWAVVFAPGRAGADGHIYSATNEKWKSECGICHAAYPPKLLPPSSWNGVMAGLDKHFGTDASLDPATATEILDFLQTNAGRERGLRDGRLALSLAHHRDKLVCA